MSERKEMRVLGLSWGDIASAGKTAFPYIHQAGAGVLNAFGAGALVAPVEQLEQRGGLLPTTAAPDHVVQRADFVIVVPRDPSKQPIVVAQPEQVDVRGGRPFAGNGYAGVADLGSKFSFGLDAPTSVEVIAQGKKSSFTDAKQVLFCKGVDVKSHIAGDTVMAKSFLSTILGALGFGDASDNYTVGIAAGPKTLTNKYLAGTLASAGSHAPTAIKTLPATFGFQFKTSPKGRKFTSLVLNRSGRRDPQKTIRATRAVAQRAQQSGQAVLTRIAKARAAGGKKATVLGAPAAPIKKVAPKTGLSIAALEQRAKALVAAGSKLAGHVDKYAKVVDNEKTKAKAAAARSQQVTRIHGISYFQDILGEFSDAVGADWEEIVSADVDFQLEAMDVMGVGEPVPDPLRPGLLTDGSPDPAYGYGGPAPTDPSTGVDPYAGQGSTIPGPPDYGAGSPPTLSGGRITLPDGTVAPQEGVDYAPDPYPNGDDPTFWDCPTDADLPLGAVVYDGSQTPPFQGLGNYTVFFGVLPGSAPPKGGPSSGYSLHDDGWWLLLQGTQPSVNYSGDRNYDKVSNPDGAMVYESKKNNWGPLMGNPQGGWTRGLRFSPSGPNGPRWFWFFDTAARVAPWAVAGMLQAQLNDAITQYKAAVTAGQTDYLNAQLQDKLSAQAAAEQARSQAATDAQVAQQSTIANAQDAIEQQRYNQQLQQAQLQAAQQASQLQAQEQTQAQQANALQLQYFQEHPEAMFAPTDQGGGGEAPADGGGGGGDDDGGGYAPQPDGYGGPGDGDAGINWNDGTAPAGDAGTDGSEDDLMQEAGDLFPGE